MKTTKIITLVLAICMLTVAFCSCGSDGFVGKWYHEEEGACLDVRSDGTYKLEGDYGTGRWQKAGDGFAEIKDFYGDTDEMTLGEDDKGKYIEFANYGKFYKGE